MSDIELLKKWVKFFGICGLIGYSSAEIAFRANLSELQYILLLGGVGIALIFYMTKREDKEVNEYIDKEVERRSKDAEERAQKAEERCKKVVRQAQMVIGRHKENRRP